MHYSTLSSTPIIRIYLNIHNTEHHNQPPPGTINLISKHFSISYFYYNHHQCHRSAFPRVKPAEIFESTEISPNNRNEAIL